MYTNQKILVNALREAGVYVQELDPRRELLKVSKGAHSDFIYDRFSSRVSHTALELSADKFLTKKILVEEGIPCPDGQIFDASLWQEALQWATGRYPLVLKPNWGSHGDHIVVNIENELELNKAIGDFAEKAGWHALFILEKCHLWPEYRLFITELGDFAVVQRQWSHVIGDGCHSIAQLVIEENLRRAELKATVNTSLCPIVLDDESDQCLAKQNLDKKSVPCANELVYLRHQSNLAKGGVSINMTAQMQRFKSLAIRVLGCFKGLPLAGLDMLCEDIHAKTPNFVIIEVNSNPGLSMHVLPAIGTPEEVGPYVAKVMVPWAFE